MKYFGCVYKYDWRGNYTPRIHVSEPFDTADAAYSYAKQRMIDNRRWTIKDKIFGAVEREDGRLMPNRIRMDYDSYDVVEYESDNK